MLTLDNFNPDGYITPDELDPWIQFFHGNKEIKYAHELWAYCSLKKIAMEFRLKGQINSASVIEGFCDLFYNEIPGDSEWKW